MQKTSKKTIIISIIALILAVLAYFYFSGSPTDSESSLEAPSDPTSESSIAASNVLTLLNQISSLDIDADFFSNQVYQSLVDHTVIVLEQNVGRPNPFAPSSSR